MRLSCPHAVGLGQRDRQVLGAESGERPPLPPGRALAFVRPVCTCGWKVSHSSHRGARPAAVCAEAAASEHLPVPAERLNSELDLLVGRVGTTQGTETEPFVWVY